MAKQKRNEKVSISHEKKARKKSSDMERRDLKRSSSENPFAESTLGAGDENFRALADNANDGILIASGEGVHVYANKRASEITGYTIDELLKIRIEDLAHPDEIALIRENFRKRIRGVTAPHQYETRIIRKDGAVIPIEVTASRTNWKTVPSAFVILRDITARKKLQEELTQNEQRFRAIFEGSLDAIFLADPESGVVLDANPAAEELLGRSREEIVGLHQTQVHPPRLKEYAKQVFQDYIQDREQVRRVEMPVLCADGSEKIVEILAQVIQIDGIPMVYGIFRDITERKEAEDAIRYRMKFEDLITSISTKFINLVPDEMDRGIDDALRAIGEFAGVDRTYLFQFLENGKTMDNTHEWCAIGIQPQIQSLKGIPVEEFSWVTNRIKGGETVHIPRVVDLPPEATAEKEQFQSEGIESLVVVPPLSAGSVTGFLGFDSVREEKTWSEDVIALLRIVGEIIANALDRKWKQEALQEAEERWRSIADQSPDFILLLDPQGKILYINRTVTGLTREDVVITLAFGYLSEKDLHQVREIFRQVLHTAEPQTFDVEYKGNDNINRFIESRVGPVVRAGRVVALIVRATDVTEQKRLEEEIVKIQKLESLGILAGGIAHDFNNILSSILTNISMIKMYGEHDGEIAKMITDAEKGCFRATSLTQQMLTFARGGMPVKKTLSIPGLIRESADFALSGSNSRCEYQIPENLWLMEADEGQIGQAINNLVINADQAMPEGGIITIRTENVTLESGHALPLEKGDYVKTSVTDQGTGIPDKHRSRIFDPFFTTKQKGSGLGLTTCFSIVNRHGGYLGMDSEVGVGTSFHVYLPASKKMLKAKKEKKAKPPTGKGRVLVVDDEGFVRRSLVKVLKRLGYHAASARDGAEGVRLYKKAMKAGNPFDAVIMDLTIPGGVGGKEAVKRLKKADPHATVIVSSGYSNDPVMANYQEHGFKGVMAKPYKIEDLANTIKRALENNKRKT